MPRPSPPSKVWQRLRGLAPSLAVLWAGFWGLVTWNVVTDHVGVGAWIGGLVAATAAVLPSLWIYTTRRRRPPDPQLEVPKAIRPSFNRLLSAHDQVKSLIVDGLVDKDVLRGVEDRMDELMRLLAAEVSNRKLGGRPSALLQSQIVELTDLLVGLADAALDRRTAALDIDDRAATNLREALARMRAEEQAYREIGELGRLDQTDNGR